VSISKTIKEKSNCLQYAKSELGFEETSPGRGNSLLRADSDSKGFAIDEKGFYDHVTGDKGSIIDLVAKCQFNGDIGKAIKHLGQYYKIEIEKPKIVATYSYSNLQGEKVLRKTRLSNKSFYWQHLNGSFQLPTGGSLSIYCLNYHLTPPPQFLPL